MTDQREPDWDDITAAASMLARLVAFDTVSRNSNLALIQDVQAYLGAQGIQSRLVPNADGSKANLFATVGPDRPGGVVLSGHTDVVPVDGQAWETNPFELTERDGRLYGRGTCDMKGFLAIALALVPEMQAAGLHRPIHLALSYDEEVGCLGAPAMIARLVRELPRPRAVIVGEPTEMAIVNANKGIISARTDITGHETHSSQTHRGVSAVMVAARLIMELDRIAGDLATERTAPHPSFEPGYTTITANVIEGGTANNIMAGRCHFLWAARCLPDSPDDQAVLERYTRHVDGVERPRIQAIAPAADIRTEILARAPGLAPEPDGEAEALARGLTGANASRAVSFAAEAGQFQQAGFSTVICGPGSISQAHQPNEFLELDQLRLGCRFIRRLIAAQAAA